MRYYLHIDAQIQVIPDRHGMEFPDLAAARAEAASRARELLSDSLVRGAPAPLGWRFDIAGSDGDVVMSIPFAGFAYSLPRSRLAKPEAAQPAPAR